MTEQCDGGWEEETAVFTSGAVRPSLSRLLSNTAAGICQAAAPGKTLGGLALPAALHRER